MEIEISRPRGGGNWREVQSIRRTSKWLPKLLCRWPHVCDWHIGQSREAKRRESGRWGTGKTAPDHVRIRRHLYAGRREGGPSRGHFMERGVDRNRPSPLLQIGWEYSDHYDGPEQETDRRSRGSRRF